MHILTFCFGCFEGTKFSSFLLEGFFSYNAGMLLHNQKTFIYLFMFLLTHLVEDLTCMVFISALHCGKFDYHPLLHNIYELI